MRERPILFSGPMVRALLAGTKTQTRRIIKPQPKLIESSGRWYWEKALDVHGSPLVDASRFWWEYYGTSPFGQSGDRLWVKESWYEQGRWVRVNEFGENWEGDVEWEGTGNISFAADGPNPGNWRSRPSIHLFRKFSRITLEVTAVRVERLQDISADDCLAEGAVKFTDPGVGDLLDQGVIKDLWMYRQKYQWLWESINGPGSWDANPWVWVVEFKRVVP